MVKIISDSTCDLSPELVNRYDIDILPLHILLGEKEYKDGKCENVWKLQKDCWPLILQYGVMRFPLGTDQCDRVVFTTMGLKGHGETIMIEKR